VRAPRRARARPGGAAGARTPPAARPAPPARAPAPRRPRLTPAPPPPAAFHARRPQGFGWAIAKALAEAGAEISLGVWVSALAGRLAHTDGRAGLRGLAGGWRAPCRAARRVRLLPAPAAAHPAAAAVARAAAAGSALRRTRALPNPHPPHPAPPGARAPALAPSSNP
jgi:pyruvate dehydrogenase E2 component (dihydrolipoamide acetyltransferase)